MAQLAIKGHPTRGKEVIEILEMLGGKNKYHFIGDEDEWFVLNGNIQRSDRLFAEKGFTLEEFLEKFPYKVGDKVIVTGLSEYPKSINFMEWFDDNIHYSFDNETWFLPSALKTFKEETMEENLTIQDIKGNNAELLLNKLQEMSAEGALQTISDLYDELHTPQYPKTYEECCEVLKTPIDNFISRSAGYKAGLLSTFQRLLICRDAYWKIAGEQMGLGKSWNPNWSNYENIKYVIGEYDGKIDFYQNRHIKRFLAFPTAEMRDVFYENFKDLIEECKELL